MRILPICFLLCLLGQCFGQETSISKEKKKRFNYDSLYVITFKDRLHVSFLMATRGSNVSIRDVGKREDRINLSPNNILNIGFGIDYKWLSLETTFKIPFLDSGDPKKGKSTVGNLKANFIRQDFWITGQLQNNRGFYVTNPTFYDPEWFKKNTNYPLLPQMREYLVYVTGNYIFNDKKFSYKASVTQFQRQVKSGGSFVLGGTYATYGASNDSSMLPDTLQRRFSPESNIRQSSLTHLGVNIGYLHTFVVKKKFFVHLGFIPSLGFKRSRTAFGHERHPEIEKGIGMILDTRMGMGWNGDRSFYGINVNILTLNDNFKDRIDYVYQNVKLFYGIRF